MCVNARQGQKREVPACSRMLFPIDPPLSVVTARRGGREGHFPFPGLAVLWPIPRIEWSGVARRRDPTQAGRQAE